MDETRLAAILRERLPIEHRTFELHLQDDDREAAVQRRPDGGLWANLLTVDQDNGEVVGQWVTLVPPRVSTERTEAYLLAWLDAVPALVDRHHGRTYYPENLVFYWALTDTTADTRDAFAEVFTDADLLSRWDAGRPEAFLREEIAALGLGGYADHLVRAQRWSYELWPALAGFGAVQLGGLPILPPGVPWPTTANGPLTLLAQVDLANSHVRDEHLPAAGLLQVFADPANADVLVTVHSPEQQARCQFVLPPTDSRGLTMRCFQAAAPVEQVPPPQHPFYATLVDAERVPEVFGSFLEAFCPAEERDHGTHLLGYAVPLHEDPAHQLAGPTLPADRWRLLLQFEPDEDDDPVFGGPGIFYVMIPQDALAAGDLAAARGVFQRRPPTTG